MIGISDSAGKTPVSLTPEVIAGLEDEYRRDPTRADGAIALAEAYDAVGRYDAVSRRIYAEALRHIPANARFQRALSISYLLQRLQEQVADAGEKDKPLARDFLEENIVTLDRLVQRHPSSADITRALADLEMLAGRGYDAMNRYEQAVRLGWSDPAAIGAVCRHAVRHCNYSDDVLLHTSSLLEEIGAYADSVEVTRRVVQRSTTEAYVLNLYARQLERALREAADPLARNQLRLELCLILQKTNKLEEATTHLREFKPGDIRAPGMVKQLARLLIRTGDYRTAFDHLQNIPLDEEAKTLINDITLSLEQAGEIDTALYLLKYINTHDQAMKEAMEIKERSIALDAELEHAELHVKNERYDEAFMKFIHVLQAGYEPADEVFAHIDGVIAKVPISSYFGLLLLARLCVQRERHQQAIPYLQRLLQVYPDEQEALSLLRRCYAAIIARNPNIPEIRFKSALLHRTMGEMDKAIGEFEYCLNFDPIKDRALRELAACHASTNQYDKALAYYGRIRVEEEDCEPLHTLYELLKDKEPKKALDALGLIRRCNPQYRDIMRKIAALEEKLRKSDGKLIEDPKMKELIGNLAVGRYRYIGKIGSGGMGIVHKVFDMKNNMVVAMKILREGLQSSGKAIDRFYREARIAAKLNHRNIVNIFDYSINNIQGHSYITMEFVDGPSLRDLIEKKFAASIDVDIDDVCESLYYMSQLCDALYATHKAGIIHRDVKPDNILINSDGIVKVTDFGIVHVEEATFTPTGAMVGTPRYMSPEQIQGKKLDGRSDIYAAGIILYELLVGAPPFVSGDISYQHVNMAPTAPRDIQPSIPEDVNVIILKCLEKAVDRRHEDALVLRQDIDHALERMNDRKSSTSRDSRVSTTGDARAPSNIGVDSVD